MLLPSREGAPPMSDLALLVIGLVLSSAVFVAGLAIAAVRWGSLSLFFRAKKIVHSFGANSNPDSSSKARSFPTCCCVSACVYEVIDATD